jgi:hypothetical protein
VNQRKTNSKARELGNLKPVPKIFTCREKPIGCNEIPWIFHDVPKKKCVFAGCFTIFLEEMVVLVDFPWF